jgi:RNA polymerase sigma-70 factor, ECF subfamily
VTTSRQEAQWVLRAQCDDRDALENLLRSIHHSLRRYISGVVGPTHADDILQDVLVIVCRKIKSLHTPELLRPWVYRIASREAFRHLKKETRWREQVIDDSNLNESQIAWSPSEMTEQLTSLKCLSPASRVVLALHFQEELPLAEVAAILKIPLGTVKSRLAYGLNTIRKQLLQKGNNL